MPVQGKQKKNEACEPNAEFVRTLTKFEPRVYAFIRSLVSSRDDAEEILQETNATLWNKRDEFAEVENFLAWACGIARIEVLRLRQKKMRDRLQFSDQFVEQVAQQIVIEADAMEDRKLALSNCTAKLPAKSQTLIRQRYHEQVSVTELAQKANLSIDSIYKKLASIRSMLFECVEQAMKKGA